MEDIYDKKTFTIKNRTMTFGRVNSDEYSLPTLFKLDSKGRQNQWDIYVIGDKVYSKAQIENGMIKKFPCYTAKGTNAGKRNATTGEQQALFEAYSKWLKKKDQGYSEEVSSEMPVLQLPMLAHKYGDYGHKYLELPFGVSPKLDGIRMMAKPDIDTGIIILYSRNAKPFPFLANIRKQIHDTLQEPEFAGKEIILDGELYTHDLPFEKISSIARQKSNPSADEGKIDYYLFDFIMVNDNNGSNDSYQERMKHLKEFEKVHAKLFPGEKSALQYVYYTQIDSHDMVRKYHDEYVGDGYEGLMARNLNSKYVFKYRSKNLLKLKDFEDNEFTITKFKLGKGREEGAIIFTCTHNGKEFDVRPRGSVEKRRQMAIRGNNYVGKQLIVRYQPDPKGLSDSLPRFPVGIDIRDFE